MSVRSDIDADDAILDTIGLHIGDLMESIARRGALEKILRGWLARQGGPPENEDALKCLLIMAADLEIFTPSMSGRTAVDRHLSRIRPETPVERQAFEALGAAQFRLVRIVGREGPDDIRLTDLVTAESLRLLDSRIAPEADGLPTAMRLCPLESGRHVVISPLFALDEAMVATAMKFVRPGHPLGHRCAATLYRDVARRGFVPIPQLVVELDEAALIEAMRDLEDYWSPVEDLALRWINEGERVDLDLEARRLASADNLVDACGLFGQAGADAPEELKAAFERIAALQVETIVQRARAGVWGEADTLDVAAGAIEGHIAQGAMEVDARDLFERLRTRYEFSASAAPAGSASQAADLDRVIQRIRALRAKTVDRGCTEDESMAAAAKVAELLDRHDLTLDAVSLRGSDCGGVGIATGRKRRAPVDSCMPALAAFCDCRVWSEQDDDGALRHVLFGLKADVEAARYLHELIEATFDVESTAFRRGEIYLALRGGKRRMALNSFQVGLANGISDKLATLKAARQTSTSRSTGFDLVSVKHSVVDQEIDRLGLSFTARRAASRRYVHGEAYVAGKAMGDLFEPNATLAD